MKYFVLKIESLVKSLSICDTANEILFTLPVDDPSIAVGDKLLCYMTEPTNQVRYLFDVINKDTSTLTLLKVLESGVGVSFNALPTDVQNKIKSSDDLLEITEEQFIKVRNDLLSDMNHMFNILVDNKNTQESYTTDELADILKDMYTNGSKQGASIITFGIKYGDCFVGEQIKDILAKAGIPDSYRTEITKGVNIREIFLKNEFNIKFYENEINMNITPLPASNYTQSECGKYYLAAMRTKPFVLLAGISGTGKSRIVKEFAFASCPSTFKGNNTVAPGNYCMIEVKPNWHDSTELLGYVSSIPKPHYVVSPFINFLIKAHYNPDVPFFVCLDEMNLAPVEQYFAEFLSVLESRKNVGDTIVTEPIIKPKIVEKYYDDFFKAYNCIEEKKLHTGYDSDVLDDKADETATYGVQNLEDLKKIGIRLPANLVVIGTVNMDETTYQFSRKVIDRAMTIEMNEVNFEKLFDTEATDTLSYTEQPLGKENFIPQFASAKDALAAMEQADKDYLRTKLPALLQELDKILENTPFRIAYRVENEMIIHYASLRRELADKTPDELLPIMVDNIMMMKVLPRIGGNEDLLNEPLKALHKLVTDNNYANAQAKIEEMMTRLAANHFTSYWP